MLKSRLKSSSEAEGYAWNIASTVGAVPVNPPRHVTIHLAGRVLRELRISVGSAEADVVGVVRPGPCNVHFDIWVATGRLAELVACALVAMCTDAVGVPVDIIDFTLLHVDHQGEKTSLRRRVRRGGLLHQIDPLSRVSPHHRPHLRTRVGPLVPAIVGLCRGDRGSVAAGEGSMIFSVVGRIGTSTTLMCRVRTLSTVRATVARRLSGFGRRGEYLFSRCSVALHSSVSGQGVTVQVELRIYVDFWVELCVCCSRAVPIVSVLQTHYRLILSLQ